LLSFFNGLIFQLHFLNDLFVARDCRIHLVVCTFILELCTLLSESDKKKKKKRLNNPSSVYEQFSTFWLNSGRENWAQNDGQPRIGEPKRGRRLLEKRIREEGSRIRIRRSRWMLQVKAHLKVIHSSTFKNNMQCLPLYRIHLV